MLQGKPPAGWDSPLSFTGGLPCSLMDNEWVGGNHLCPEASCNTLKPF